MCGDATKPEHVERLLDGAKPDLMVIDPPYGVNYDSTWRYTTGISTKGIAIGKSANDDNSDWQAAYALFPGRIAYVWMASLCLPAAAHGLDACGFIRRSLIIWDKGHIVIGRGHYHWRHEPCWVRSSQLQLLTVPVAHSTACGGQTPAVDRIDVVAYKILSHQYEVARV